MKKIAVFPGSFDPFTNGHYDIVSRGLSIFDEIIIAIGHNSDKKRYFDIQPTLPKIKSLFLDKPQVSVQLYNELTSEFARKNEAKYLLRGLRNTTDFEYENAIAQVNKQLNPNLETVFLITTPQFATISSSIVRELHKFGADVSSYVPNTI